MAQMAFNHPSFAMPQEQQLTTTGSVRPQRAMSMGSGNATQLHHSLLQQQLQLHSPSTPAASPKSQAMLSNLNLLKASPQISQANLPHAFQQQLQQQQQQQQQNQQLLQLQQQQQQQQQQLHQKHGQQQLVSVTELNQIKLQLLQQQMQISQLCDQNRQLSMQMAQLLMLQQSSPKPVMQTAVAPQTPSLMSSPEGHAGKMEEGIQQQPQLKRTRVDCSSVSSDNDLFADLVQSL
ncbi:hypothetical protein HDU81_004070 [Chytriomyces hyalinus]|nr:hypothetical protein HDU81_004070 [Chytriomyces hyalinus]